MNGPAEPERAVAIPRRVVDELIAHARAELPNECCGLLVGTPGRIDDSVRTRNLEASPTRFTVDPVEHFALRRRLRGTPRAIVGAYHSHVRTDATPSASDVAEAHYPEFVNLIVSLQEREPAVRAFRISAGRAREVRLQVVE